MLEPVAIQLCGSGARQGSTLVFSVCRHRSTGLLKWDCLAYCWLLTRCFQAEIARLQHDADSHTRRSAVLTQQIAVLTDDMQRARDEGNDAKLALSDHIAALAAAKEDVAKYRDGLERLTAVCDTQRGGQPVAVLLTG